MSTQNNDILRELQSLQCKLDQVLAILQEHQTQKRAKAASKRKPAPESLTEAEIETHKARFAELYQKWTRGDEIAVEQALETMDTDQLRRFADANNLNVTTKTSKQKTLQLIGARFREKRHLMREPVQRPSNQIS
jgi:hypothetical protein